MGDLSATILAAEEGGGTSNFLLPNGTFFVVLIIFLIVLGVIGTFVVPPISKVLRERDEMVTKTIEDNRRIADRIAATDADYQKAMLRHARTPRPSGTRPAGKDERSSRTCGPGPAAEASATLQSAGEELSRQGQQTAAELQASVETLSATLASRVLGVDVSAAASRAEAVAAMSTFIGQLVGFAVIVFLIWKYVVPPVRNMMKTRQETVRTQLEESAEAAKKLAEAEAEHKPRPLKRPRRKRRRFSKRPASTPRRSPNSCALRPTSRWSESRCRAPSRSSCCVSS